MPVFDESRWVVNADGSRSRRGRENTYEIDPGELDWEKAEVVEPEAEAASELIDVPNATPAAITRAAELGVDLASVTGTGLHGKITKGDVEDAAA